MLKLILDSGAYSAYMQSTTIDIDKYAEFIKRMGHLFDACFNLDVIDQGQASFDNWMYLTRIHNLKEVVPVYHLVTDVGYLKKYLSYSPKYIALGAMSNMPNAQRVPPLDNIWENYLVDKNGLPKMKVHGFGVMGLEVMQRYPWYSVDSTSWVQFGRYGIVLIPRRTYKRWVYDENPYKIFFSIRSPKLADKGEHYDNFPPEVKKEITKYISHYKMVIGESEWGEDGKEKVIVRGIRNDGFLRDILNMLYYQNAANTVPKYPWPLKLNSAKALF